MLELYDGKLSRTVLRGKRGCEASDLPGHAIVSAPKTEEAGEEKEIDCKYLHNVYTII